MRMRTRYADPGYAVVARTLQDVLMDDARIQDTQQTGPALIHSPNGLLVVHTTRGNWVVPPAAVLRLAADVTYHIHKAQAVQVYSLALDDELDQRLPAPGRLYRLTPLLRELFHVLCGHGTAGGQIDRMSMLVDLLQEAGIWHDDLSPRCLGSPQDARVARICEYIRNNLDTPRTLQDWANDIACDTRTLHRLFVQEFGLSFVQWRQQARLMAALEWLARGRQVMDVALDLGYQTQSAFTAMFRREMGITPTQWQANRRWGVELR